MRRIAFLILGGGLALAAAVGCGTNAPPTTGDGPPPGGPHPPGEQVKLSPGMEVYMAQGCARCHGNLGMPGPGGPPGFPGDLGVPAPPGGPPPGGPSGGVSVPPGGPGFPGGPPGGPGGPPGAPPGGGGPGGPGGPGGGGGYGMKGPDLSHVGKEHDKKWIAEYIRDPQSKKADAKMPKQDEKKLSDKDLDTLAEWLAGMK